MNNMKESTEFLKQLVLDDYTNTDRIDIKTEKADTWILQLTCGKRTCCCRLVRPCQLSLLSVEIKLFICVSAMSPNL